MTSYTPMSSLPYPVMSDPPNAPDQIRQLGLALEPKLVNRYKDASTRNARITAPTLGMLTFRDDVKQYEYWDGTRWIGATQNIAVASTNAVSSSTATAFTTDESKDLVKCSVKLSNPSSLYRMLYVVHFDFNAQMTSTAAGLYSRVRVYRNVNNGAKAVREWANYSAAGSSILKYSGALPVLTGYLPAGSNVTVATWMTVEKGNSTKGTLTLTAARTQITIVGMSSV
jgi:hypothetical protein